MSKGNGHIVAPELTTDVLLEVLVEAVKQLTEMLEEVKEINVELLEKVSNLSLPGESYGIED